jgi:hypothetical protein
MKLLLIMVLSSTLYELKEVNVPTGQTCSDVYNNVIVYKENPLAYLGTGQVWINGYYKGKIVGGYICEAI